MDGPKIGCRCDCHNLAVPWREVCCIACRNSAAPDLHGGKRRTEHCEWNTKLDAYTYRYCRRPSGHEGEHDFSGGGGSMALHLTVDDHGVHGGERADTGAPGELPPARLEELERLHGRMPSKPWRWETDEKWAGGLIRGVTSNEAALFIEIGGDKAIGEGIVAIINAFPVLLAAARERNDALRDYQIEGDQTVSDVIGRVLREMLKRTSERDTLRQQVATLTAERDAAVAALTSKGYRRTCDIPACNCGDTWAHGGHADTRLREISDALGEYRQGKTLLGAVEELIEARERGADTPGGADLLSPEERAQVELARHEMRRVQSHKPRLGHWLDPNARTFAIGDRERLLAILDRLAPRPPDPSGGRA